MSTNTIQNGTQIYDPTTGSFGTVLASKEVQGVLQYHVQYKDGNDRWIAAGDLLTKTKYDSLVYSCGKPGDAVYIYPNPTGTVYEGTLKSVSVQKGWEADKPWDVYCTVTSKDYQNGAEQNLVSDQVVAKSQKPSATLAHRDLVVINVSYWPTPLRMGEPPAPWWNAVRQKSTASYRLIDVYVEGQPDTMDDGYQHMRAFYFPEYTGEKSFPQSFYQIGGTINFTSDTADCGALLAGLFDQIYGSAPANYYALKSTGHGTEQGMFADFLSPDQAGVFLKNAAAFMASSDALLHKFAFIDWGTNCNTNSIFHMLHEADNAEFVLSSELERGGFLAKDEKAVYPDWYYDQYWNFFASLTDKSWATVKPHLEEALQTMMDTYSGLFNSPAAVNASNPQSLNLYDMAGFTAVLDLIDAVDLPGAPQCYVSDFSGSAADFDANKKIVEALPVGAKYISNDPRIKDGAESDFYMLVAVDLYTLVKNHHTAGTHVDETWSEFLRYRVDNNSNGFNHIGQKKTKTEGFDWNSLGFVATQSNELSRAHGLFNSAAIHYTGNYSYPLAEKATVK